MDFRWNEWNEDHATQHGVSVEEAETVRRSGYFAVVVPRGGYYEVYAGQYTGKDEAKEDLKRLASKYRDSFIRKR